MMKIPDHSSPLSVTALVMDPHDSVAVAARAIEAGQDVRCGTIRVVVSRSVAAGERFAIRDIPAGEYVRQFGQAFGRSKGINGGEAVTAGNIEPVVPPCSLDDFHPPVQTKLRDELVSRTFLGYARADGRVGTRNYYLIVPTSMCASETCVQIAAAFASRCSGVPSTDGCDGVVAIPHTEGCGCDSHVSIARLLTVLKGYIGHPNVGGCLVVDLGCEQTDRAAVEKYLGDVRAFGGKPIDWITIQKVGGVFATRERARTIVTERISALAALRREPMAIAKLVVGTECGASDSFSGITANPIIGDVVDAVIWGGGVAILSEIPEMVGTLSMLLARFRSRVVAEKFVAALRWYEEIAARMGVDLVDNLVPKNVQGGLVNSYIKSLGAVMKGGTTAIEDVVEYGERITKPGLSIMQGPGGDLESVTGLVASGATVVCFSTGHGTPTGNAICPVIKIASNDVVFDTLTDDLDFNAGRLLSATVERETLAKELFDLVIDVASGKRTAAERLHQRQFQIWTAGKLSV